LIAVNNYLDEGCPDLHRFIVSLGYHERSLNDNFPDLGFALKARYSDYRKASILAWMQPVLKAALHEYPPPPLTEVTRRFGQKSTITAYKFFPNLCHEISANYIKYQKDCALEKREQLCQEIRTVALKLHAEGREPKQSRVKLLLAQPGSIINTYARDALREVRRELGYEK